MILSIPRFTHAGLAAAFLLCSGAAWAGNVSIPNTFAAHTPAVAIQVNDNFGAVATAVNDSAIDIAALQAAMIAVQNQLTTQQSTIDALNTTVSSQQTTINTLTTHLNAVRNSTVMALDANLVLLDKPDPNNPAILYRTVQFKGINVQVVNGTGYVRSINGLGNLIVGYNQTNISAAPACSDGQYPDQTSCLDHGAIWASNQRSGSHNLIVGASNSYSESGGFVAGQMNIVNGENAVVSGGYNNKASASAASISGGSDNAASGQASSVSGGRANTANANEASISGGMGNTASAHYASVSGGRENNASGWYTSISGGWENVASGTDASVSGGQHNRASGGAASVSGGNTRTSPGLHDWSAGALFETQ